MPVIRDCLKVSHPLARLVCEVVEVSNMAYMHAVAAHASPKRPRRDTFAIHVSRPSKLRSTVTVVANFIPNCANDSPPYIHSPVFRSAVESHTFRIVQRRWLHRVLADILKEPFSALTSIRSCGCECRGHDRAPFILSHQEGRGSTTIRL